MLVLLANTNFAKGSSEMLSAAKMMGVLGGDTDPNVCHSKSTDDTCSGACQQTKNGPYGYCYWDFNVHNCQCYVKQ